MEIGTRACGLADEVDDAPLKALTRMELSSVHYCRGDVRRAEALLTQALAALGGLAHQGAGRSTLHGSGA